MSQENDEIFNSFIEESKEHLATIEEDIVALESQGENLDNELINKVFRAIHTIKGSAGFFSLQNLKTLAHAMENLLGLVRSNELPFSSESANTLLEGIDLLKTMIDNTGSLENYDPSVVIGKINDIITPGGSVSKPSTNVTSLHNRYFSTIITNAQIHELQKQERGGKFVYLLSWKFDDKCSNTSEIIHRTITELIQYGTFGIAMTHSNTDENIFNQSIEIGILYSSVVEPTLLFEIVNVEQTSLETIVETMVNLSPTVDSIVPAGNVQSFVSQPATEEKQIKTDTSSTPQANNKSENSIRVNLEQLNRLMSLAGELVLARNSLLRKTMDFSVPQISSITQQIDTITSELQDAIMSTRMQSVGILFTKFKRIVRDLSLTLGKKIDLSIEGEDVELDKTIIETLNDPLTHLVRNSADHGIETPERRIASGKNETGKLLLTARHETGHVIIEIIDDGAGIDPERIRSKAIENKLISREEAAQLNDKEIIRYIFKPGFSTAEKITEVSGRGVGLDVVLSNLTKIGGAVDIESQKGKGTKFILKLPLTLAIIPSILVETGHQRFAIPQLNVIELVRIAAAEVKNRIEKIGDSSVIRLRGVLIPLIRLSDVLMIHSSYYDQSSGEERDERRHDIADRRSLQVNADRQEVPLIQADERRCSGDRRRSRESAVNIIIVTSGVQPFGLVIDQFIDSEEIVVKPIGSLLSECIEYAGATILGDGSVAFILNIAGLGISAALTQTQQKIVSAESSRNSSIEINRDAQTYLIIENNTAEQFAIPLGSISRIERIKSSEISDIAGQRAISYGDTILSLLSIEKVIDVKPLTENAFVFIVIFKAYGRDVGIMVSRIIDIVDITSSIDFSTYARSGILGSVVLNNAITLILDLHAFVDICIPEYRIASQRTVDNSKKVLVVEDSPFFQKQFTTILSANGFEVITASNGAEGIELLDNNADSIGVCFTDIEMPVMDGIDMSKRIRSDSRFKTLPIIAVTSLSGDSAEKKAREAGVSEYLIKMDREQIIDKCRQYLTIYTKEPRV
jgi:two-component system chemotaxis sensor kinase CheA